MAKRLLDQGWGIIMLDADIRLLDWCWGIKMMVVDFILLNCSWGVVMFVEDICKTWRKSPVRTYMADVEPIVKIRYSKIGKPLLQIVKS